MTLTIRGTLKQLSGSILASKTNAPGGIRTHDPWFRSPRNDVPLRAISYDLVRLFGFPLPLLCSYCVVLCYPVSLSGLAKGLAKRRIESSFDEVRRSVTFEDSMKHYRAPL